MDNQIIIYEPRKWSLYVHINKINGKKYVGITKQSPKNRWGYNGYNYRNQCKKSNHFYNAICKYGWNNFEHIVILSGLTLREANMLEILYISIFKSFDRKYGYNATKGGGGFLGVQHFGNENPFFGKTHSEQSRKIMSEHHYVCCGKNNSFYGKHHTKDIKNVMSQKAKERYKNNPQSFFGNHSWNDEERKRIGIQKSHAVVKLDSNYNLIEEYPNIKIAIQSLGLKRTNPITDCCLGRRNDYKGFKWMYKKDYQCFKESVSQY